jgi:hypothetical protein
MVEREGVVFGAHWGNPDYVLDFLDRTRCVMRRMALTDCGVKVITAL